SAFISSGYRLARVKIKLQEINDNDTLVNLYVNKINNSTANTVLQTLTPANHATEVYHKFTHPFNFHSWSPYLNYPDYSFTIFGQNILNTIQSQLYYTYNSDENYHLVGYTGIYGGWYLQPFIDVHETLNRSGIADSATVK